MSSEVLKVFCPAKLKRISHTLVTTYIYFLVHICIITKRDRMVLTVRVKMGIEVHIKIIKKEQKSSRLQIPSL